MDRHRHPGILVRLPSDLLDRVRIKATESGESVSEIVRRLLREWTGEK